MARTFQNIRLFSGMTLLENLLVAQHNKLMKASGYTMLGLFGFSGYGRRRGESIELAKHWLEKADLVDRADDPAGDLPYGAQRRLEIARAMCTESGTAVPRRAGRRPQPARESRSSTHCCATSDEHGTLDPADRARHVGGDADFRPCRGARIWPQDLRRQSATVRTDPASSPPISASTTKRSTPSRQEVAHDRRRAAPLLLVRGVKTYYGNIMALTGVDVDVNEGEIVTLIGANGAGKSTLMMTIFGAPRAREGTIIFAGPDITQMPTHEIARMRIAQSPEGRRIFPRMTVLENLQMGAASTTSSTLTRTSRRCSRCSRA